MYVDDFQNNIYIFYCHNEILLKIESIVIQEGSIFWIVNFCSSLASTSICFFTWHFSTSAKKPRKASPWKRTGHVIISAAPWLLLLVDQCSPTQPGPAIITQPETRLSLWEPLVTTATMYRQQAERPALPLWSGRIVWKLDSYWTARFLCRSVVNRV